MTDLDDLTEEELITAHKVLKVLRETFQAESKEGRTPQEAKTLDSAMWYVEEQMPEELQEEYAEQ